MVPIEIEDESITRGETTSLPTMTQVMKDESSNVTLLMVDNLVLTLFASQ